MGIYRHSDCSVLIGEQVSFGTVFEELTAQNWPFFVVPTFVCDLA